MVGHRRRGACAAPSANAGQTSGNRKCTEAGQEETGPSSDECGRGGMSASRASGARSPAAARSRGSVCVGTSGHSRDGGVRLQEWSGCKRRPGTVIRRFDGKHQVLLDFDGRHPASGPRPGCWSRPARRQNRQLRGGKLGGDREISPDDRRDTAAADRQLYESFSSMRYRSSSLLEQEYAPSRPPRLPSARNQDGRRRIPGSTTWKGSLFLTNTIGDPFTRWTVGNGQDGRPHARCRR